MTDEMKRAGMRERTKPSEEQTGTSRTNDAENKGPGWGGEAWGEGGRQNSERGDTTTGDAITDMLLLSTLEKIRY